MNIKSTVLASVLAIDGFGVSAQEATPLPDFPQSTMTRAEVAADLAHAKANGFVVRGGEATVFADSGIVGSRDRADVRAEAAQLLADPSAKQRYYIGG